MVTSTGFLRPGGVAAGRAFPDAPVSPTLRRAAASAARVLVVSVFVVIFAGALVKSHEAGLSVPDWPTTFGRNMFLYPYEEWTGGVFYEHGHRLLASGVGFVTLVAAGLAWASRVPGTRGPAALAVVLVSVQGLLGGLTVWFGLPAGVSVAHGVLAQTFLLVTITLERRLSRPSGASGRPSLSAGPADVGAPGAAGGPARVRTVAAVALAVLYGQLLTGAVMRHWEAGLAVPDFPTVGGGWLPLASPAVVDAVNRYRLGVWGLGPVDAAAVWSHLSHRFWAVAVLAAVGALALAVRRAGRPAPARLFLVLVSAQAALGVMTVLVGREPWVTSLHVVTGAGLLAAVWLLGLGAEPALPSRTDGRTAPPEHPDD